jgi:hypothetical protein
MANSKWQKKVGPMKQSRGFRGAAPEQWRAMKKRRNRSGAQNKEYWRLWRASVEAEGAPAQLLLMEKLLLLIRVETSEHGCSPRRTRVFAPPNTVFARPNTSRTPAFAPPNTVLHNPLPAAGHRQSF